MTNSRRWLRLLAILTVTIIALALRLRAVDKLPIDFDEDDYLLAAQHYAKAILVGNWAEIVNWDYNYEHPPLPKLTYALAISSLPEAPEIANPRDNNPNRRVPEPHFHVARSTSATIGTLEVLVVALFNPLAGFFLAIHSWQIKYTSEIMLEALPALTSLLAVLLYVKSDRKWNSWLALSAVALGLTAAGKYLYCVAGIAIAVHWLWKTYPNDSPRALSTWGRWVAPVVAWGLLAIAVFMAADPYLWPDPITRLKQTVLFHGAYAQSREAQQAGYPIWQPFVWLSGPEPGHPDAFIFALDLYITLLAALGLRRLWQKQPVFVLWLGVALGFLLVWPTKWPQYILVLTAPLSIAAAEGFVGSIWEPVTGWLSRKRDGATPDVDVAERRVARREGWKALPWLLPGLVTLLVIALFPLIYQGAMALTDFNAVSIKDGINGGVWREVWLGLAGQKEAVSVDIFSNRPPSAKEVHYAGPGVLQQMFTGLLSDVLFFNVLWVVLSVSLQALIGVSAALMLNRPGVRFTKWWGALFILPWAIPEFVGALIWLRIFDPSFGWLTQALPPGGALPSVLRDTNFSLVVLLVAAAWGGFPLLMLAAIAGLKLIPPDSYEAAALDGATAWQKFRYITWPLLMPLLAPAIIVRSIFAFNQFYLFWTMQAPFPLVTFATVSYFLFSGFGGSQYAISAAINIFTVAVLVALILVFNRWSKAAEGVTYA